MGLGTIAAVAGLVLNPFGASPELMEANQVWQSGKPWYVFDDQGPILQLIRTQKFSVKSCKAWSDALISVPGDELTPVKLSGELASLRMGWEPWGEKDIESVQDCDDFPCKVKLDRSEVETMKKSDQHDRLGRFLSLVMDRVGRYQKTQARKGYERPEDPIDPWKFFESRGFKSALSRPESPALFVRKLNFAPDRMLTMHQVLDRRVSQNSAGTEAVVWLRDVYTDHYFDSWGEWGSVHCRSADRSGGELMVIQSVLAEMDLLKNKGLFVRALFGKYRSAFEENGKVFLDAQFQRMKTAARAAETARAAEEDAAPKRPTAAH